MSRVVGEVHPNGRRTHRCAHAARREAPSVHPVPRTDRVDHAGVDDPCRRHSRREHDRRIRVSPPLGVRRRRSVSSPRAASPSTSNGCRNRSAGAPLGATRIRRRSSRRSRACWSESCRSTSCAATRRPDIRRVKEGRTLVEQGSSSNEMYLLLNGVLVVEVDGDKIAELGPGAVFGERAVLEGSYAHRHTARRHRMQGRRCAGRSDGPRQARPTRRRTPPRGGPPVVRCYSP